MIQEELLNVNLPSGDKETNVCSAHFCKLVIGTRRFWFWFNLGVYCNKVMVWIHKKGMACVCPSNL